MPLSKAQKNILDKFNIPVELQNWLNLEFNPEGKPLSAGAPDFLMVMADLLHAAEVYLDSQRVKLNRLQNPNQELKASPEEWQVTLAAAEGVVKDAWLNATAFWRMMDEIVNHPAEYGVTLQAKHLEYAFKKKILPLVEMLKWENPEFFNFPSASRSKKIMAGIGGGILGGSKGLIGGVRGGTRQVEKRKTLLRPFLIFGYSLMGLFTGFAMGASVGGMFGYETAHAILGSKLGYAAAYFNPFNDPIGSKHQQEFELKKLELLFKFAYPTIMDNLQDSKLAGKVVRTREISQKQEAK